MATPVETLSNLCQHYDFEHGTFFQNCEEHHGVYAYHNSETPEYKCDDVVDVFTEYMSESFTDMFGSNKYTMTIGNEWWVSTTGTFHADTISDFVQNIRFALECMSMDDMYHNFPPVKDLVYRNKNDFHVELYSTDVF